MLHMLSFHVADTIFECCMNRSMEDVPIERPGASNADGYKSDKTPHCPYLWMVAQRKWIVGHCQGSQILCVC